VDMHEPKQARQNAMARLTTQAANRHQVRAAQWKTDRSPQQFMARHRTGARFAALPSAIQDEALRRLSAWAKEAFGALDTRISEDHEFVLDVFQFQTDGSPGGQ